MTAIYCVRNNQNGKVYVGSAVNVKKREYQHFYSLKKGSHHNRHLQRAFDTYGNESFSFVVLEILEGVANDLLLSREQYWINHLAATDPNIGYNINPCAANCAGRPCAETTKQKLRSLNLGKKQSKETIEKKRRARLGKQMPPMSLATRNKISKARKGQKHSETTKLKIGKAISGNHNPFYGKSHTDETKEKISKKQSGKKASAATKMKMSQAAKGREFSVEHRRKIGQANSRRTISPATRLKMRMAKLGRTLPFETRKKMSEAHKKRKTPPTVVNGGWGSDPERRLDP